MNNSIDDIRNYLNLVEYSNHYKPVEEVIEQPLSNNIYSLIDAMRELREEGALMNEYVAETASTGLGGGSAGSSGGQMVGGPETYEQEYDKFKRKGPRRITAMTNEALDSSYDYRPGEHPNTYYFTTDSGIKYMVNFVHYAGKKLDITFSAYIKKGESTRHLTGTGDSRKVFGTIGNIAKKFIADNNPPIITFTADNNEPSRVKLYKALSSRIDQALPDYTYTDEIKSNHDTTFVLKRNDFIGTDADINLSSTDRPKRKVKEALDSSYKYRPGKNPGIFYFSTENGQEYKVEFASLWGDDVSVAFAARGQGDEHKFGLTGTGNSRKIFGTVIKIVKDYITKANPKIISFSANNNEPSRLRLYKMLAAQADKELPDYNFAEALNSGLFTTFYLTKNDAKIPTTTKAKAFAWKALDKIVSEDNDNTITLTDLYKQERPDDNERIWDYGTSIWNTPFEIKKLTPHELSFMLCHQYDVEEVEDLFHRMSEEQHEIMDKYITDPNLSDYIIVTDNGYIVDGNHRAIAAALLKRSLRHIDIADEEDI